jgi:hypothetical protein
VALLDDRRRSPTSRRAGGNFRFESPFRECRRKEELNGSRAISIDSSGLSREAQHSPD